MKKKVVIISGGSQGLGKSLVRTLLADEEHIVATFSRKRVDFIDEMEREYGSEGRFTFDSVDLSDSLQVKDFVTGVYARFGSIDVLINNAGVVKEGVLALFDDSDMDSLIDINLKGTLSLTRECVRFMLTQDSGRIVNISSIVGSRGYTGLSVYSATKAALDGFTRSLARELGRRNITVNSVAPGYLKTDMTHGLTDEQMKQISRRTPLGRMGESGDVVPLILFLCSDESSFITGQTFVVDGGLTI